MVHIYLFIYYSRFLCDADVLRGLYCLCTHHRFFARVVVYRKVRAAAFFVSFYSYFLHSSAALWTMLLVSLIFLRFCMGVTFIMVSICMNNSVPKYRVGAINGLSVSLTALTRCNQCMCPSRVLIIYI